MTSAIYRARAQNLSSSCFYYSLLLRFGFLFAVFLELSLFSPFRSLSLFLSPRPICLLTRSLVLSSIPSSPHFLHHHPSYLVLLISYMLIPNQITINDFSCKSNCVCAIDFYRWYATRMGTMAANYETSN